MKRRRATTCRCSDCFGRVKSMHPSRYSAIALVAYHGGRYRIADATLALGQKYAATKALFYRTETAGWLVRGPARGSWRLATGVITDLDALHAAVANGDQAAAEKIACDFGPPLAAAVGSTTDWIDSDLYGGGRMTPREELLAAADQVLATAVERWPHSAPLRAAVDALYDD